MIKVNIKQNRNYFNAIFLTTLNKTVGEDFYTNLFTIYLNVKQFIALREAQVSVTAEDMDTESLKTNVDIYTEILSEVIQNITNQKYDDKLEQKTKQISHYFNLMLTNIKALNRQFNPLANSAEELTSCVASVIQSYKQLQTIGTKRIFSASCKEDCRVNFLSRAGSSMQDSFEKNWQLAQTESKTLITLANVAMQVISKCPTGTEPITEANLKKLKNSVFNVEHLIA